MLNMWKEKDNNKQTILAAAHVIFIDIEEANTWQI